MVADPRPPLVRLYERWNALLLHHVAPGVHPLLRLEQGAGLVRAPRAERIAALMDIALAVAAPRLYLAPAGAAGTMVRPKIRARLGLSGAGLVLQVGYFGTPPGDPDWRAAFAHLGADVCPLPPRAGAPAGTAGELANGEVCLHATWREPAGRMALVQVCAGRRAVAVPLLSIAHASTEDSLEQPIAHTRSLADLLGDEAMPAAEGRPAVLRLRRRGEAVALRVEALSAHGTLRVLPVGPLMQGTPWLLGLAAADDGVVHLVVDPLALPGLLDAPAQSGV